MRFTTATLGLAATAAMASSRHSMTMADAANTIKNGGNKYNPSTKKLLHEGQGLLIDDQTQKKSIRGAGRGTGIHQKKQMKSMKPSIENPAAEDILKNIVAIGGLEECTPNRNQEDGQEDTDVGILGCGKGEYCIESATSTLGGFCMMTTADHDERQQEHEHRSLNDVKIYIESMVGTAEDVIEIDIASTTTFTPFQPDGGREVPTGPFNLVLGNTPIDNNLSDAISNEDLCISLEEEDDRIDGKFILDVCAKSPRQIFKFHGEETGNYAGMIDVWYGMDSTVYCMQAGLNGTPPQIGQYARVKHCAYDHDEPLQKFTFDWSDAHEGRIIALKEWPDLCIGHQGVNVNVPGDKLVVKDCAMLNSEDTFQWAY